MKKSYEFYDNIAYKIKNTKPVMFSKKEWNKLSLKEKEDIGYIDYNEYIIYAKTRIIERNFKLVTFDLSKDLFSVDFMVHDKNGNVIYIDELSIGYPDIDGLNELLQKLNEISKNEDKYVKQRLKKWDKLKALKEFNTLQKFSRYENPELFKSLNYTVTKPRFERKITKKKRKKKLKL